MDETVIITLSKPIKAHGETVTQLDLRSPTSKEYIEAGRPPYVISADAAVAPDLKVCAALLSKICAIPPSSVEQLAPSDLFKAVWQIVGFTGASQAGEALGGDPTTASNA